MNLQSLFEDLYWWQPEDINWHGVRHGKSLLWSSHPYACQPNYLTGKKTICASNPDFQNVGDGSHSGKLVLHCMQTLKHWYKNCTENLCSNVIVQVPYGLNAQFHQYSSGCILYKLNFLNFWKTSPFKPVTINIALLSSKKKRRITEIPVFCRWKHL